jgi:RHS repeat-associated protein
MAMKKRYYTVNGEIIGEQTTGQERIDYLTDPLGNITATIDQNAKVLNRYTYKPFGEVLSKEGTAPDPKFLWVGAHGYRQTGNKHSDVYVRARHYDTRTGRWTTRDPLWPRESAYGYGGGNPVLFSDASGLQIVVGAITIRECKSWGAGCPNAGLSSQIRQYCRDRNTELYPGSLHNRHYVGLGCDSYECCGWCWARCGERFSDWVDMPKKVKDWVKIELPRRNPGCLPGPPRVGHPNPQTATECGDDSQGTHWLWQCNCNGRIRGVVTVLCCECFENGAKKTKCRMQPCH